MNQKITILSVNISEKKGITKVPVNEITLNELGILNDAHAGNWHRQISLLGKESILKFAAMANREVGFGEFAENLSTEGIELYHTHPLDKFVSDDVILEVTQIGKSCHGNSCAINKEVGNCVMPKEGIFCRIIKSGTIKPGDTFSYQPKIYKTVIITLSDRASRGDYEDRSGPRIKTLLENYFEEKKVKHEISMSIIPDNEDMLRETLSKALSEKPDYIFTTGGTGVGERDITPEIVKEFIHKEIPGIMELIRFKYGQQKPNALLSRGIAGVTLKTQLYALPGSIKAVNEYMEEIMKTMEHLVLMLYNIDSH